MVVSCSLSPLPLNACCVLCSWWSWSTTFQPVRKQLFHNFFPLLIRMAMGK